MPVYVFMLRGINVGPHKRMKMDALRQSFEDLGFEQVKTYIQSGNVVFKAANASPSKLSKMIEEKIRSDFGFSVPVILRTADELAAAIAGNPFLKEPGIDTEKLHVMFLSHAPAIEAIKQLSALASPPQRLQCLSKEIYFYLPNGVAESVLMKAPVDRILSVTSTARNWRTVNQLSQMCQDCH
jgi:uncharacterized protein (DUF1697 family)